ncbi:MAG: 2,3-bisphosphoglycerate-independent phosphoglycerate mutase [Patescibacteria group bacterium]|nr:2,3-bisphosphoglycerate-independent phosphoglycerate mutase [Patescibacteria group bacterium]
MTLQSNSDTSTRFVLLVILDGWGVAPASPGNAISKASTIVMDKLWNNYPHCCLLASGEAVGLPEGEDGNTETGHLNLGAGSVVYQDLQRINIAIKDGSFFKNQVLLSAVEHTKKNNSTLHYMGLIGAGGVHSNMKHLSALIDLAASQGVKKLSLHLFTDGRDSPPMSAISYINDIQRQLKERRVGVIASVMGRYWAMDRDQRWDRTIRAYDALTLGRGNLAFNVTQAINEFYEKGITDEFIEPTIFVDANSKPLSLICDNDSIVFFNFRIDRPRQLTKLFISSDEKIFGGIYPNSQVQETKMHIGFLPKRGKKLNNLYFVTMTDYGQHLKEDGAHPAFPPQVVDFPLSGVISASGFIQLKITESEKERFVTFYFNGLRENAYEGEKRIIVPSPKVATYDQKPEMSAYEITDTLLQEMSKENYKLIVVNFPNADMVGHTGNIGACVKAVEVLDQCLGRLANFVTAYGGTMVVTADHGNAEEMINLETGAIDTEHSTYPVPFIVVSDSLKDRDYKITDGRLCDVAPTIIALLKLTKPVSMQGRNLLEGLI